MHGALSMSDDLVQAMADLTAIGFSSAARGITRTTSLSLRSKTISSSSGRRRSTSPRRLTAKFVVLPLSRSPLRDRRMERVRGEIIGLGVSGDPYLCPVKSVVRRMHYARQPNLPPGKPLVRCSCHVQAHHQHAADGRVALETVARLPVG